MGRRRATPPATRSSLAVSLARLRLRRPRRFGVDHVGAGAGVGTGAGAAGAGAGAGARMASLLRSVAQRRACKPTNKARAAAPRNILRTTVREAHRCDLPRCPVVF
eukprot:scaffold9141_cov70-Phaeocystis_antarctica.AAC.5